MLLLCPRLPQLRVLAESALKFMARHYLLAANSSHWHLVGDFQPKTPEGDSTLESGGVEVLPVWQWEAGSHTTYTRSWPCGSKPASSTAEQEQQGPLEGRAGTWHDPQLCPLGLQQTRVSQVLWWLMLAVFQETSIAVSPPFKRITGSRLVTKVQSHAETGKVAGRCLPMAHMQWSRSFEIIDQKLRGRSGKKQCCSRIVWPFQHLHNGA